MKNTEQGLIAKSKFNLSPAWLIPIIALILASWLIYKDFESKGLIITIQFDSADGLEAGQTKIKLKNVDLGTVEKIHLSEDLEKVIVSARLPSRAKDYINENTIFWVERARVDTSGVSGLGTLLSGAYIGVKTEVDGSKFKSDFIGLDAAPIDAGYESGTYVDLVSQKVDGMTVGAPVYYRSVKVGAIEKVELSKDFQYVDLRVFVFAPYDELLNKSTKFWRVSGFEARISAEGVDFSVNSLQTMLTGAVAFDSNVKSVQQKGDEYFGLNSEYVLHNSFEDTYKSTSFNKEYFLLYFDQSIRGLNIGAPVDFRGVNIGRVRNILTQKDSDNVISFPVEIEIEPERIGSEVFENQQSNEAKSAYKALIKRGLRAKLESGSIVTGQLLISFDFHSDQDEEQLLYKDGLPILPTMPGGISEITSNINQLLTNLNTLDFAKINEDLTATLAEVKLMTETTNSSLQTSLDNLNEAVTNANLLMESFSEGSSTRHDIDTTLKSIQGAASSVKSLADRLEEQPNSLIFGK